MLYRSLPSVCSDAIVVVKHRNQLTRDSLEQRLSAPTAVPELSRAFVTLYISTQGPPSQAQVIMLYLSKFLNCEAIMDCPSFPPTCKSLCTLAPELPLVIHPETMVTSAAAGHPSQPGLFTCIWLLDLPSLAFPMLMFNMVAYVYKCFIGESTALHLSLSLPQCFKLYPKNEKGKPHFNTTGGVEASRGFNICGAPLNPTCY